LAPFASLLVLKHSDSKSLGNLLARFPLHSERLQTGPQANILTYITLFYSYNTQCRSCEQVSDILKLFVLIQHPSTQFVDTCALWKSTKICFILHSFTLYRY